MQNKIKIGLFGFGCVGQGLYDIISKSHQDKLEVVKICVKEKGKERPLPAWNFTYEKKDILENEEIDIHVELINDADEAFEIVSEALTKGKRVISANKKMIAEHLDKLIELQQLFGGTLLYEASSCGSIPIIRLLENYFSQEQVFQISGIFNGSSNYILSKIFNENITYGQALKQAQDLGFAEKDPGLDVGGYDAAHKLCIISGHTFGILLKPAQVLTIGIQNLASLDYEYVKTKGQKIKLVATAYKTEDGEVAAFVLPAFVAKENELFEIEDEFNAVLIDTEFAGRQLFKGKGAGGHPTGSAVFSDITVAEKGFKYSYAKFAQSPKPTFDAFAELAIYLRYKDDGIIEKLALWNIQYLKPVQGYKIALATVDLRHLLLHKNYLLNMDGSLISNHLAPASRINQQKADLLLSEIG